MMSKEPSVPVDSQASTPAAPAPAPNDAADDTAKPQSGIGGLSGKTIGIGAAVGIGSAAIVAALLFTNRGKK